MDNPKSQVAAVVHGLTTCETAAEQAETLNKYFTQDAAFEHPMCTVRHGENSRQAILGIYRWYRQLSPHIDLTVHNVTFDEKIGRVYLDITQKFTVWLVPIHPARVRLLCVLDLVQTDGKWYVTKQQDFYDTTDMVDFAVPGGRTLVAVIKHFATFACNINYRIFSSTLGWWGAPGT